MKRPCDFVSTIHISTIEFSFLKNYVAIYNTKYFSLEAKLDFPIPKQDIHPQIAPSIEGNYL
jgi:hypothetical protein